MRDDWTPAADARTLEAHGSATSERHPTVDALRGVAAFAVVWFHFTNGDQDFLPDGVLKRSGHYGWLGVEVFFVISGFVIPWALWRAGYRLSEYPRFLLKRVVRLDPPYLASILLSLAGMWLAQRLYGEPFEVSPVQLLLHLGYLNAFFDHPWINSVYWTLAIEVQYYVAAGLFAAGLTAQSRAVRRLTVALFAAQTLLPVPGTFLCSYALLFVLGVSTFQHRAGLTSTAEHLVVVVLAAAGLALVHPPEIVVAGVATALVITFATLRHPVLLFLGQVSYSLYLIHGPLGGHMMRLADHLALGLPGRALLLVAFTALTVAAAWLLYQFVERPARRWASAIRYR